MCGGGVRACACVCWGYDAGSASGAASGPLTDVFKVGCEALVQPKLVPVLQGLGRGIMGQWSWVPGTGNGGGGQGILPRLHAMPGVGGSTAPQAPASQCSACGGRWLPRGFPTHTLSVTRSPNHMCATSWATIMAMSYSWGSQGGLVGVWWVAKVQGLSLRCAGSPHIWHTRSTARSPPSHWPLPASACTQLSAPLPPTPAPPHSKKTPPV